MNFRWRHPKRERAKVKPAFEFYYNVHGLFFKIFANGEVYINDINGSDLGEIGTVINRIPNEAYKQETKMTREEAAQIIQDKCFGITATGQADRWADTLEALGLIKFDEPEHIDEAIKRAMFKWNKTAYPTTIKEALAAEGLQIVKKS